MTTGFVYGISDYACALIHCTYGMYAMLVRYSYAMFSFGIFVCNYGIVPARSYYILM